MSSPKQLNQSIPAYVHINPPFRHCLEVTVVMASLPLQPSLVSLSHWLFRSHTKEGKGSPRLAFAQGISRMPPRPPALTHTCDWWSPQSNVRSTSQGLLLLLPLVPRAPTQHLDLNRHAKIVTK